MVKSFGVWLGIVTLSAVHQWSGTALKICLFLVKKVKIIFSSLPKEQ